MNVVVDTCVWSRVLRRRRPDARLTAVLAELVREGRVALMGPIRQEILSGVPDPRRFEELRARLAAFDDVPLATHHFETAAAFCNACRRKGVQGSPVDFLICSVSHHEHLAIFTVHDDFRIYQKHLGIPLFVPE